MKIVWLCSFPVSYFRELLDKYKITGLAHPATWMIYLYNEFRKFDEIELFIISESKYARNTIYYFDGKVNFYWLKKGIPFIKHGFPPNFRLDTFTGYFWTKRKIIKLLEKIKPDLINVHGTEYAFSSSVLGVNIPKLISIQGFISEIKKNYKSFSIYNYFQSRLEIATLKQEKFFMTGGIDFIEKKIKSINTDAIFFPIYYPINKLAFEIKQNSKTFDFIYVGGFNILKGIEDYIEALGIIKKKGIEFKAKVIGLGNQSYQNKIFNKVKSLNISNNVDFMGFLKNHDDVIKEISQARVFVLPTYCDTGPRSIAESMAIGTPVIAYDTDGISSMIENNQSGILVEKGNIEQLAQKMIFTLSENNTEFLGNLSKNAKKYSIDNFSSEKIAKKLFESYKEIVKNWKE